MLNIKWATNLLGIKKAELFDILEMDGKLKKRFLRKKEITRKDKLPETVQARVILLSDTLVDATECFEDEVSVRNWFNDQIPAFNFKKPIDKLREGSLGMYDVRVIIGQIEHGIYS